PATAANHNVTWSSDDESVAIVDGGFVRPVAPGTATITVTTVEGGFTDTMTVEVLSGWTEFALHPRAKVYYVSSSEGDDDNDGLSPSAPFATILQGMSRIQGGDWLLLKR